MGFEDVETFKSLNSKRCILPFKKTSCSKLEDDFNMSPPMLRIRSYRCQTRNGYVVFY